MAEYYKASTSPCHTITLSRTEVAEAIRFWLRYRHVPRITFPTGTERFLVRTTNERDAVEMLDPIVLEVKEAGQ